MTRVDVDCLVCNVRILSVESEEVYDVSSVRCKDHPDADPKVTRWTHPEKPHA